VNASVVNASALANRQDKTNRVHSRGPQDVGAPHTTRTRWCCASQPAGAVAVRARVHARKFRIDCGNSGHRRTNWGTRNARWQYSSGLNAPRCSHDQKVTPLRAWFPWNKADPQTEKESAANEEDMVQVTEEERFVTEEVNDDDGAPFEGWSGPAPERFLATLLTIVLGISSVVIVARVAFITASFFFVSLRYSVVGLVLLGLGLVIF